MGAVDSTATNSEVNVGNGSAFRDPRFEIMRIGYSLSCRAAGRARRFVFVPPNLDGFMTVRNVVEHELDGLRRWFIFVPPNLLGASDLFTALRLEKHMDSAAIDFWENVKRRRFLCARRVSPDGRLVQAHL